MKKACTVSPAPKLVVEQEAREGRVRCMFVQWPLLPVGEKQGGKGGTWMVGRGTKPKFSGFGEVPSTLREQAVLYAFKNTTITITCARISVLQRLRSSAPGFSAEVPKGRG